MNGIVKEATTNISDRFVEEAAANTGDRFVEEAAANTGDRFVEEAITNTGDRFVEKAITNIDDKFVEETIMYRNQKHSPIIRVCRTIGGMAACAAVIIVLSLSGLTAAAAAGSIQAYEVLCALYPGIAVKLIPIQESCEDNGIKMCVEAINVDGNKADIYISMQDLTGDRIDETIDLFDSYSIHTNVDQIGGCRFVSYDRESKTATFLITVEQNGKISGKSMHFSVSKFLTGKTETAMELTQIKNIVAAENIVGLGQLDIRGAGGLGVGGNLEETMDTFLSADPDQTFSPVDGAEITAYGFIDGKLHIQAYYKNILEYDNHGWIELKCGETDVHPVQTYSFWDSKREGSYEEYIFDIGEDEIDRYKIFGEFVTCKTLVNGQWEVYFPIGK